MGFFNKASKAKMPYERDWEVGPITRQSTLASSEPGFSEMAERVVLRTGTLDRVEIIIALNNLLTGVATHYASRATQFPMDELDRMQKAIFLRKDFAYQDYFDALSYFGTSGIAVGRLLCNEADSYEETLMTLATASAAKQQAEGGAAASPILDPGLPEDDFRQIAYRLLNECGVSYVIFGEGDIASCWRAATALVPELRNSTLWAKGIGEIPGLGGVAWIPLVGPSGAMITFHVMPNADFDRVIARVGDPIESATAPWHHALASLNALVPDALARKIWNTSQPLPVWELPDLAHLRPADSPLLPAGLRERIRVDLLNAGWAAINDDLFKSVVAVPGGRTQLLWCSTAWSLSLRSPVAQTEDETVPSHLLTIEHGSYELSVIGGFVTLGTTVPLWTYPPLDALHEAGLALAAAADVIEASLSSDDDL